MSRVIKTGARKFILQILQPPCEPLQSSQLKKMFRFDCNKRGQPGGYSTDLKIQSALQALYNNGIIGRNNVTPIGIHEHSRRYEYFLISPESTTAPDMKSDCVTVTIHFINEGPTVKPITEIFTMQIPDFRNNWTETEEALQKYIEEKRQQIQDLYEEWYPIETFAEHIIDRTCEVKFAFPK